MARVAATALVALGGGAVLPGQLADSPSPKELFGPVPPGEKIPAVGVHVYEYGFEPSRLVIKAGQTVVWQNIGKELHNIAPVTPAGERVFRSAEVRGTTRHLFPTAGTFPYHCSIHGQMRGVIVVRETL
jgi:plastocyanin